MDIRIANKSDVSEVLELQHLYHINSISEEDKEDGFVTMNFTRHVLCSLINEEQGLFVMVANKMVVAYAVIASWDFCSTWPNISNLIEDLALIELDGIQLNKHNSCQFGPMCIHRDYRGLGVYKNLLNFCKERAAPKYNYFATYINKINTRSFMASKKTSLKVVNEFSANGNHYYTLACSVT
jgi:hypothetical protein